MKKVFAFFSSLLIFAGLKAQTVPVKKETVNADSIKQLKTTVAPATTTTNFKDAKAIKGDYIKHDHIKAVKQVDAKDAKTAIDTHIKH